MKTIFFALHFPPPFHGVSYINTLIKGSEEVARKYLTTYFDLSFSNKVSLIPKNKFTHSFLTFFHTILGFFKIISSKFDVFYISLTPVGITFFRDALFVFAASLKGKKVVVHLHGKGVVKKQDTWIWDIFYKLVFESSYVIHLSEKLYSDVAKYVSKEKCYFLPNTISDKRVTKKIEKTGLKLSYISNIRESKGAMELVYIMDSLVNDLGNKDVVLNVIGDFRSENFEEKFKSAIKELGLNANINFLGALYDQDKIDRLVETDIFIYPTLEEAWGIVILEAMQAALPIVAYDEGAISDMVLEGENGFLVAKYDRKSFAKNVDILLSSNKKRNAFGIKSRELYEKHFTYDSFQKSLCGILNEISSKN